jgi:type I restriction enzyme S subunit
MKVWKHYSIADLISKNRLVIGDGYRAKLEEFSSSGLPFARVSNINNGFNFKEVDYFPEKDLGKVGNKISETGDVVFTSKGTVGRFAFVTPEIQRFVYSPQLCFWRVLDTNVIDPRFLFFWMSSREFFLQFNGVKGQTDMADYVSLADQRRMHITLPHIQEQRLIAGILGALDDKIELNRRMNQTLESMARAVFRQWFVENEETKHWEVQTLAQHIQAEKGLSYKGEGLSKDSGMPMHNLNSVYEGGGYKYEGIKYYTGEYRERHILKAGDIIVTNTEQGFEYLLIGYPAIVPKHFGETGLFTHHIFRVRPSSTTPVKTHYLYFLLMSPEMREQVIGCTNGTTVNMLSVDGLRTPRFKLPPIELIEKFEQFATPIFEKIELLYEESRTLASLRDTLLPKLMRGEVRVKDMESIS